MGSTAIDKADERSKDATVEPRVRSKRDHQYREQKHTKKVRHDGANEGGSHRRVFHVIVGYLGSAFPHVPHAGGRVVPPAECEARDKRDRYREPVDALKGQPLHGLSSSPFSDAT